MVGSAQAATGQGPRRSPRIPHASPGLVLGIDLGGTKIAFAVSDLSGRFRLGSQGIGNFLSSVDRLQVPPKEPETALPALADHGTEFRQRVAGMNLVEVPIAPRSPWQNAYAERFMGSLRRECLDP